MSIRVRPLLAGACCIGAVALSACSSGSDEESSPDQQARASEALRTGPIRTGGGITRNKCLRSAKPCLNLIEDTSIPPRGSAPLRGIRWELLGSHYKPGSSNVRVWIQEVGTTTTLEYQQGITTDASGMFDVEGSTTSQAASGIFAAYREVDHPLLCGKSYRAITSDPVNGVVSSDPMTTGSCPAL